MGAKNIRHYITEDKKLSVILTKADLEQLITKEGITKETTTWDLYLDICTKYEITPREQSTRGSAKETFKELGTTPSEVAKFLRDHPKVAEKVKASSKDKE